MSWAVMSKMVDGVHWEALEKEDTREAAKAKMNEMMREGFDGTLVIVEVEG